MALLAASTTAAQAVVDQCPPYLAVDPHAISSNVPTPPLRIVILDERAQRIMRQIPLAPFLASEPNCSPNGVCQPTDSRLDYFYGLSWSPDGRSLAVLYLDGFNPPLFPVNGIPTVQSLGVLTLLVVRADGSSAIRLADPHPLAEFTADSGLRIWDLHNRQLVSAPIPATGAPAYTANAKLYPFNLPFATAYSWTPNGQLGAHGPSLAAPQGPIGMPQGGAAFSPWQPSYLVRLAGPNGDSYVLRSAFWAWSSDSRYVAAFGIVGGQVNVQGRTQPPASEATTVQIALLPPGGPAMAAAVAALADAPQQTVPRDASLGGNAGLPAPGAWGWEANLDSYAALAWSHDGTRLAVLTCAASTNSAGIIPNGTLTVYSMASGKLLGTATVPFTGQSGVADCASDLGMIEWTPDDSAILVTNGSQPTLTFITAPAAPH